MLWCKLDLSLSLSLILAMNIDLLVTLGDPKLEVNADILIVFDISDILLDRIIGNLISSLSLNEERWS